MRRRWPQAWRVGRPAQVRRRRPQAWRAGHGAAEAYATLVHRERALQEERKRVAKEMKLQERKRQRLLVRAQGLSDADLLDIITSRAAAKAKAKSKAKAAPKGKAKAKAKAKAAASSG